jgi:hypothetical protein
MLIDKIFARALVLLCVSMLMVSFASAQSHSYLRAGISGMVPPSLLSAGNDGRQSLASKFEEEALATIDINDVLLGSGNQAHPRKLAEKCGTQIGQDIDGEDTDDKFGFAVAVSRDGNRVAIGARFVNLDGGSNFGHVRIFDLNVTTWTQVGEAIDGEAIDDEFGFAVAISEDGNRVAIGAPRNDGTGSNSGRVRVFDLDVTTWTQVGQDIDGENSGDGFGFAVALSANGSRVAIGAPGNDGIAGRDSGHVRVFDLDVTTTWTQVGEDIDGKGIDDLSGFSVDITADGNRVAIGAPMNDGNDGNDSGHVRVFDLNVTTWTQVGQDIDGEAFGDQSGNPVVISADGSRVAIGAVKNDGNAGSDSGHVRVFDLNVTRWTQVGEDIDGEAIDDESGFALAISEDGNRIAVGAVGNHGNAGSNSGHVRIFDLIVTTWTQFGEDIDGEASDDRSGFAVAMSADGSRLAIGAPDNDGNAGSDSGHVRVYENEVCAFPGISAFSLFVYGPI